MKKIQAVELTELAHAAVIHKTKTGPQGPVLLFTYFRVSNFVSMGLSTPVPDCDVSPDGAKRLKKSILLNPRGTVSVRHPRRLSDQSAPDAGCIAPNDPRYDRVLPLAEL